MQVHIAKDVTIERNQDGSLLIKRTNGDFVTISPNHLYTNTVIQAFFFTILDDFLKNSIPIEELKTSPFNTLDHYLKEMGYPGYIKVETKTPATKPINEKPYDLNLDRISLELMKKVWSIGNRHGSESQRKAEIQEAISEVLTAITMVTTAPLVTTTVPEQ